MTATLDQLETRVVALEQAPARSTQIAPNYLTVDPTTGAIGAKFTGNIHAAGVDLDAAMASTPPTADQIRWIQVAGGAVVASLVGYGDLGGPGQAALTLASDPARVKTNGSAIQLLAQGATGVNDGTLTVSSTDPTTPSAPKVQASAGAANVTIIGSGARSSFPQFAANVSKRSIIGGGTLTWAGGTPISNALTVLIPNSTAALCVGLMTAAIVPGDAVVCYLDAFPVGGVTFRAITRAGGLPAAGAQVAVAYMVWET